MEASTSRRGSKKGGRGCSTWNEWLPPAYAGQVVVAGGAPTKEWEDVWRALAWAARVGDTEGGGRHWARQTNDLLDLKLGFTPAQAGDLANGLLALILNARPIDLTLQARWAQVLARLLKKCKGQQDEGGSAPLRIGWRPLLDLVEETYFSGGQFAHRGRAIDNYHIAAIAKLVRSARSFFGEEATNELWDALRPQLCPHANSSLFKAQTLLSLFHPGKGVIQPLLEEIFTTWGWIENSPHWDFNWLSILGRIAKKCHGTSTLNWAPVLPAFYTHVLRVLGISLGGSNLPRASPHPSPREITPLLPYHHKHEKFKSIAKVIIYTLQPSGSSISHEAELFARLISLIEPYP